jgi:hypothetical protein
MQYNNAKVEVVATQQSLTFFDIGDVWTDADE